MAQREKKHTVKQSKNRYSNKVHPSTNKTNGKAFTPKLLLIGIAIIPLLLRLLYIAQIASTPLFHGLAMDSEAYDSFALQMLKGNFVHQDSIYLNPLYPVFLAIIYLIFGHSQFPVAVFQSVLDSSSCLIIYYIASTLFTTPVGIIAAFFYAFYGIAIFYTGILLSPTIEIFSTLLLITSLLLAERKGWLGFFLISGIVLGTVTLLRPNIGLFLLFLPLWCWTSLKNKWGIRRSLQGIFLLLIGFFIVSSLITVRNYMIEKRLSISSLGGINFYIGNNPKATGLFMCPYGISDSPIEEIKSSIYYAEKETGKKLTPSQASHYWLFKGLMFIKDNPLDALFLFLKKCALFWRKEEIPLNINYPLSRSFAPLLQLPLISFGIIAPLALLGIILSLRKKNSILLLTLFTFSYMLSVILFFVSARYRLPIVPSLIIYSSYALIWYMKKIRAKEINALAPSTLLLAVLFIFINKNFNCFKLHSESHYNNLAKIYYQQGEFDEAIVTLKEALAVAPRNAETHSNLGIIYRKQGLIEEAIKEYKEATALDYHCAEAHLNLGFVYDEKGLLDEAIAEFKNALAINPLLVEAYYSCGILYKRKGMLKEAMVNLNQALSLNPHLKEAHIYLGRIFEEKEMPHDAIAEYKKSLSIDSDYALAHNNLALLYYSTGNYQSSITHCDTALRLGFKVPAQLLKNLAPYR